MLKALILNSMQVLDTSGGSSLDDNNQRSHKITQGLKLQHGPIKYIRTGFLKTRYHSSYNNDIIKAIKYMKLYYYRNTSINAVN